jgi:protein-disulfide isomerase/uncharacterized membrane protein
MAKSAKKQPAPTGRLAAYRPLLDRLLFGLALAGLLVVVHLWIQEGRGFDRGCWGFSAPTATVECENVLQSDAGKLAGVSNVVWGLLYYLVIAGLGFLVSRTSGTRLQQLKQLRAALIAIGFLYSGYLVYYQATQIGAFCKLCLTSAGIAAALFVVQLVDFFQPADRTPASMNPKPSREPALFGGLALVVALLAGADLLYFNNLDVAQAQPVASQTTQPVSDEAPPPAECLYRQDMQPAENYASLVNFTDPFLGKADAPVVIIEYFDPNCPHCKHAHPVMTELAQKYGDKVRIYPMPFVLWQYSLPQVEALYAAAQEKKYFEMLEKQFELQQQGGLSLQQLRAIAGEIGMDANLMQTRIESGIFRRSILQQRQQAIDLGVQSVPAVMVNGRFVTPASRTVECLGKLITEAAS